jgi:Ca2+-binding RTX toxin-like protein
LVVNEKGGKIIGHDLGIVLFQPFGQHTRTVNHGLIDGGFQGAGKSDDYLINDGTIKGFVSLGSGDDTFDTRGGSISDPFHGKTVFGDIGDDILITDNARFHLHEGDGEGEDIVKSTVSYALDPGSYIERLQLIGASDVNAKGTIRGEELWGNAGDNTLEGLDGADELDGKGGNDILNGGKGADTFIFATGYDKDTIALLQQGSDQIDVSKWKAIASFSDLKTNHAKDHGHDVWIIAGSDTLIISDLHRADLHASDFIF